MFLSLIGYGTERYTGTLRKKLTVFKTFCCFFRVRSNLDSKYIMLDLDPTNLRSLDLTRCRIRKLIGKEARQSHRNGSTKERLEVRRKGLENVMIAGNANGPGVINYFCVSAEGREYVNPEPILVPEPPPVRRFVPGGYKEMSILVVQQRPRIWAQMSEGGGGGGLRGLS